MNDRSDPVKIMNSLPYQVRHHVSGKLIGSGKTKEHAQASLMSMAKQGNLPTGTTYYDYVVVTLH